MAKRDYYEVLGVSKDADADTIKKAYAGKFMAQIILADGVISKIEEQFFYLEAMKEWEEKHDLVYK